MVSTWMGDHSSVEMDAVVKKYSKIPGTEKRGLPKKLLEQKKENKKTSPRTTLSLREYVLYEHILKKDVTINKYEYSLFLLFLVEP